MSKIIRHLILIALVTTCFVLVSAPQSWVAADENPPIPPLLVPGPPDSTITPPDTNDLDPLGTIPPDLSMWDYLLAMGTFWITT